MNCSRQRLGGRAVDPAVQDDDAAERADRVAGERGPVGAEQIVGDGHAARVVVLDDDARRALIAELRRHRPRPVQVEDVVERELLAVQLAHAAEYAAACSDLRVERGALMRILAVRQVHRLLVGADEQIGEVVAALGEPARDRGVVAGRVGERLGGQRLARRERQRPARRPQLVENRVVRRRAGDDRGEGEVLRGRADHRRPADVDVLDHLVVRHADARDGAPRTGRGSRTRDRRTRCRARRPGPCAPDCRAARADRRTAAGSAS